MGESIREVGQRRAITVDAAGWWQRDDHRVDRGQTRLQGRRKICADAVDALGQRIVAASQRDDLSAVGEQPRRKTLPELPEAHEERAAGRCGERIGERVHRLQSVT